MRHRNSKIVLNKSKAHTKATVRNLITALIKHGQIKTTATKAKILRKEVEKLISKSKKREQVHAIREANKVFFENEVTKKFFDEYLPSVQDRTSGYVRTFKVGNRSGDDASMVLVKLIQPEAKPAAKETTKKEEPKTAKKPAAKKTATKKAPAKKKTTAKKSTTKK